MSEPEILYSLNSVAIACTLFGLIVVFNELGFRLGRFVQEHTTSEIKTLTGSIQASILGLLALLLGFTFSMAMQRYDNRSMAVIDEANAIGTAALRVQLLPESEQEEAFGLLRDYVDLRISAGKLLVTQHKEREREQQQIAQQQQALWTLAVHATTQDPRAVTSGAFVSSLNAVFDTQDKRDALLHLHVPESVMLLLFIVFVSSGGMMGYSSGLSGKRIIMPVVLVSLLITLIVFLIIDLDRPRRGLIEIDQSAMLELQQSMSRPFQVK
jgi:hypothetical protein